MNNLRGTGVALITPFTNENAVDFEALRRLLQFTISEGIDYLVINGTTAESVTLTKAEKTDILAFVKQQVKNQVPIVYGVGGNCTAEIVELLSQIDFEGITAILSVSPYYNKPSQEGIYQHYKALASATAKPIILYNVPGRTGSNITAETTVRLANDFENISGIKEASGNMNQCMQILRDKPQDFMVVSGDDNLAMAQIASGMDGVISVAANSFPKEFSMLITAALEGNFALARAMNDKLLEAYDILFAENNPAGVKAFLSELEIIENHLRLPLVPLSKPLADRVKKYLVQFNETTPHV